MREELLSIGDVASKLNLSHRTLRFYEDKGLVSPHRDGQSRWYSKHDMLRLKFVSTARYWRFTLSEISDMLLDRTHTGTRSIKSSTLKAHRGYLAKEKAELDLIIKEIDDLLSSKSEVE